MSVIDRHAQDEPAEELAGRRRERREHAAGRVGGVLGQELVANLRPVLLDGGEAGAGEPGHVRVGVEVEQQLGVGLGEPAEGEAGGFEQDGHSLISGARPPGG